MYYSIFLIQFELSTCQEIYLKYINITFNLLLDVDNLYDCNGDF